MKTEAELFTEYCKANGYDKTDFVADEDYIKGMSKTTGFKAYVLKCQLNEVMIEIFKFMGLKI